MNHRVRMQRFVAQTLDIRGNRGRNLLLAFIHATLANRNPQKQEDLRYSLFSRRSFDPAFGNTQPEIRIFPPRCSILRASTHAHARDHNRARSAVTRAPKLLSSDSCVGLSCPLYVSYVYHFLALHGL
jgi:hypothetical protein